MGHQDKEHFTTKHDNRQINETIAQKIKSLAQDNHLDCASAHKVAKTLNTTPSEIGVQIDLLEYKITACQLGLFGYSGGKNLEPAIDISPELNERLDETSKDKRISCLECWTIARELKLKRLDIGSACEKKEFRIKPCQLGAF